MFLLTAALAAPPRLAPLQPLAVHTNTADVRDLHWDGEVLWAATAGGLEAWSEEGLRLAHEPLVGPLLAVGEQGGTLVVGSENGGALALDQALDWVRVHPGQENLGAVVAVLDEGFVTRGGELPSTTVPGLVGAAAAHREGVLVGTQQGTLHFVAGALVVSWELGCPITDIASDGAQARIACLTGAWSFDASPHPVALQASAASPEGWGLVEGSVLDAEGLVGRIPGRVTALERLPSGWAVGTDEGLYLLGDGLREGGLRRLTPEGQICGNFVTGVAEHRGELVVSTFQDGACRFDGERWWTIPDLPALLNDVVVWEGELVFASSDGLYRGGHRVPVLEERPMNGPEGTHHEAITALAVGDRLWISDLLGPVSVDAEGTWRRRRFSVYGTSYQAIAACGQQAWIASEDAGLSHFDGRRWRHHDASNGLPDDWVMAVACTDDQAWAGLYDDGLWRWDGRGWEAVALPDPWVLSLAVDGDSLYAGTLGGAWRLLGEEAQPLALPDPRVHQLNVGADAVYAGTEGGLAVYARTP